jgi:cellobiose phosphorylase
MVRLRNNGQFSFNAENEVVIKEKHGDMTREPWLMLLARRNQKPTDTLCWGLTNNGTSFARIGTQEGDILNGFVHEDPYKTRLLGTYAYFRTQDGKYFSNAWYPVLNKEQELETTMGFGYLKFNTAYNDFGVETVNFVPNGYDAMVQIIKITNNSSEDRKVTMFNVNPVNIGDARDIQFSGFNTLMMGGALVDKELNANVWRFGFGRDFDSDGEKVKWMFGKVLVHTTSLPGNQFATRYDEFVGHHTNTMANPAAVAEDWDLPCRNAEEACSALSSIKNTFTLKAGESKEIIAVSAAPSTEDYYYGKKSIKKFLAEVLVPENAKKMLEEVKSEWLAHLCKLSVKIEGVDEILNPSYKWLQYQCEMVMLLNRMKSRFHSGFEYGFGFRDILQDILALLPYDPKPAKELIKFTAQQMFSDGFVYHNFYVSAPGNKDFVACDDPMWLIYAVAEYIKESGDFAFLDEVVPYCDEKEELPPKEGTMLEHLKVAIAKVWKQSDNGLPYMLMADWNDDLSGNFTSASTMAAQQLYKALNDMTELLNERGIEKELAEDYAAKAKTVKEQVEGKCIDTDGKYIRAVAAKDFKAVLKDMYLGHTGLDADELISGIEYSGAPVDLGSTKTDGLTFFEPIAWAGFSGIAGKERFDACKKACERDLDDKYGIAICQSDKTLSQGKVPADTQGWKRNAPGKKENGGEFRHLESWYIASLCIFGYGEEAHDIYMKTLPALASKDDPYLYAAERFVYPEYVSGPASNDHGKAGHTWLTGTAPTRLNVLIDWIFGIRRSYGGLLIDPCVSSKWEKFSAVRTFRNTTFNISYSNPGGVNKGVKAIKVDGKEIGGNVIPLSYANGGNVSVEVLMGDM